MTYVEFLNKAMDETIIQADNGLWYLEPDWRQAIRNTKLSEATVSDRDIYFEELKEILELEVKRRNTVQSKKPYVIGWLYELITAQVEPAMLQEETDYIKQVTEFMKANHELKSKEQET